MLFLVFRLQHVVRESAVVGIRQVLFEEARSCEVSVYSASMASSAEPQRRTYAAGRSPPSWESKRAMYVSVSTVTTTVSPTIATVAVAAYHRISTMATNAHFLLCAVPAAASTTTNVSHCDWLNHRHVTADPGMVVVLLCTSPSTTRRHVTLLMVSGYSVQLTYNTG
jgi:hypothetical protein